MQAIKIGWTGQTFALARCSDTQGKRPRRRKSKEERKTMVEIFINKYRKANNGNFPSINHTHKEVGGSFYTVREIVREIIQENRILGPGDSASNILTLENFDGLSPVETLSLDGMNNLPLMVNEQTNGGIQMDGFIKHDVSSEGILTSDGVLNRNNIPNLTESDETVILPSTGFVSSPQSDDMSVVSGDDLGVSNGTTFFDKTQDGTDSVIFNGHLLQFENETCRKIDGSLETGNSKVDRQSVISQTTNAISCSDDILPASSDTDICAEVLSNALLSPMGNGNSNNIKLSDIVIQNQESNEVTAGYGEIQMNGTSLMDINNNFSSSEPDQVNVVTPEETFDAAAESEKFSFSTHDNDGYLAGSDYAERGAPQEKNNLTVLVDSVPLEEQRGKSMASKTNIGEMVLTQPLGQNFLELSSSKVSETKVVESVSSINIQARGGIRNVNSQELIASSSIMNVNSQELIASSTEVHAASDSLIERNIMDNTEITKKNFPEEADLKSMGNASQQQQMSQPDPFWGALKKIVAAFIKFWTE